MDPYPQVFPRQDQDANQVSVNIDTEITNTGRQLPDGQEIQNTRQKPRIIQLSQTLPVSTIYFRYQIGRQNHHPGKNDTIKERQ